MFHIPLCMFHIPHCHCHHCLVPQDDPSRCEDEPRDYLIYGAKGTLGRISLDVEPLWEFPLPIPATSHPISVDVHYEKRLLFYAEADLQVIR